MDVIHHWAGMYPSANVALCADENVTILESDDEAEFRAVIRAKTGRDIPDTLTGGSRPNRPHWFYKRTPACGNDCPSVPRLFEFRNQNQYVVGPGSIHPEGFAYRFHKDVPMVEMPDWLVAALCELAAEYKGRTHRATGAAESRHVKVGAYSKLFDAYIQNLEVEEIFGLESVFVPQGERHNFLVSVGAMLHNGKRSKEEIEELLWRVHDEYCQPSDGKTIAGIAAWVVRGWFEARETGDFSNWKNISFPTDLEPINLPSYVIGVWIFSSQEAMNAWPEKAVGRLGNPTDQDKVGGAKEAREDALAAITWVSDGIQRAQLIKRAAAALKIKAVFVSNEIEKRIEERKRREEKAQQDKREAEYREAPVNPAELIKNLEKFFEERLHLPQGAALVLAHFVLNTRTFELFDTTPYICLESAVPRCGKSTTGTLIRILSHKGVTVTSVNEAIFRLIDKEHPTLCLDESEMLAGNSERAEAVRSILNEGYKGGGQVPRCVGEEHEVRFFGVFCPKTIASIGGLKGALLDRCIVLHMERVPKGTKRKSTRLKSLMRDSQELIAQMNAYAVQYTRQLAQLYLDEPDEGYWPSITDREAELWGPLLMHAKLAGPEAEARLLAVANNFGQT
jgi:hypothetical protein